MRIFKSAWFVRFARKQGIPDSALVEAVQRAEKGLIDADLGGGVIKQRLARPGQGKSGGYRAILFYCQTQWTFFIYGFAKSERDNIDDNEETYFKRAAKHVLGLSEEHLAEMIAKGQFLEVNSDG